MTVYRRIPAGEDRAVVEMLTSIRAGWRNGGAICECFRADGPAATGPAPVPARARLRAFLGSEALAAVFAGQRGWWLPDDGLPAVPPGDDELTTATAAFSDDLGAGALLGHFAAGATLHRADDAWHPWLHGVHWDRTYVLLDDAGTAAIIVATDVD